MSGVKEIVIKYKEKLNEKKYFRSPGKEFPLTPAFSVMFSLAIIQDKLLFRNFLQEIGLIKSEQFCGACGSQMKLTDDCSTCDGQVWHCGNKVKGRSCKIKSIRDGSWFSGSNLSLEEAFILTCEILLNCPEKRLNNEYGFASHTIADWTNYMKETLVEYLEVNSRPIGGVGKFVEVDGHLVEKQWVFGGIERESGKVFLVPVPDQSLQTILSFFQRWILPGSTIISDCWKSFKKRKNFKRLTVSSSLKFVDSETALNSKVVENTWWHFKHSLPEYCRQVSFANYVADFMLSKLIKSENEDVFIKFIEIIKKVDWNTKKF